METYISKLSWMNRTVKSSGMHVICRSQCVSLFQPLRKEQINVARSGSPETLEGSGKVLSNQEHLALRWWLSGTKYFYHLNTKAPLILHLFLVGIPNTYFHFLLIVLLNPHRSLIMSGFRGEKLFNISDCFLMPICHCVHAPFNSWILELPPLPHSLDSRSGFQRWIVA